MRTTRDMTDEKRGGRRVLQTTPELFVAFLKRHDGAHRTYMVDRALPDDARIVGGQIAWNRYGNIIEIVLESAEWQDSSVTVIEPLESPLVTVWYAPEGTDAQRA